MEASYGLSSPHVSRIRLTCYNLLRLLHAFWAWMLPTACSWSVADPPPEAEALPAQMSCFCSQPAYPVLHTEVCCFRTDPAELLPDTVALNRPGALADTLPVAFLPGSVLNTEACCFRTGPAGIHPDMAALNHSGVSAVCMSPYPAADPGPHLAELHPDTEVLNHSEVSAVCMSLYPAADPGLAAESLPVGHPV